MPMHNLQSWTRLVLLVMLLPLPACATDFVVSSPTVEGRVIEQETRKPVADALVVVLWKGHAGHSGTVCYRVETATSDAQGAYRIKAWEQPAPGGAPLSRYRLPMAYKSGYEYIASDKDTVYLKPFTGTPGERLNYLRRVSSASGCASAGESEKNLLPLRSALLEQARQLADKQTEQEEIEPFLFQVEALEFGYEVAERRQIERIRSRK